MSTIVAGIIAVTAGGVFCLRRALVASGLWLQAAGLVAVGAGGLLAVLEDGSKGAAFSDSAGLSFGIDPLSGFFLTVLAMGGVPALVFAVGYLRGHKAARSVSTLTALFLLALIGVLTARSVPAFLTFWELMTLCPAGIILITDREVQTRRSVFEYLAITHLGGVGVWVSLLLLASRGVLADPSAAQALGAPLQALVALTAIVGFGTKAGLMPLHSWLPRAHPLAPSHISALMSGLMIKVALYGLIRVLFEWLGPVPAWLALVLLALGAVSALGGVLYALFQHELKRLLAFHSIENIGIIVLGLGASLLFRTQGHDTWAALAFAAALFHTLNHAIFKGLLFLGAGSFAREVHGLELDKLGGLLRRMPWTGSAFLVGAMAIAGLPPLNGFVSEWLTLESLVHVATGAGQDGRLLAAAEGTGFLPALMGALATLALAMTAALAVLCFAKVVGLVLLGPARRPECEQAREASKSMVVATSVLAIFCILLGLFAGVLMPTLMGLLPGSADASRLLADDTVASLLPWKLGLPLLGTGGLPTLSLALLLAVLVGSLALLRGRRRASSAPVWTCGQRVEPALLWTSTGFTMSLRLVLRTLLRSKRTVEIEEKGGVAQRLVYRGVVPHLFDRLLYRPVLRWSLAVAAYVRRLQSGSLQTYVAYLLGLVIVVLAVAWLWGGR